MQRLRQSFIAAAGLLALAASGCRQQPNTTPSPRPGANPADQRGAEAAGITADTGRRGGAGAEPAPRPYARVITEKAKSRPGLFRTHRVGNKLYYEVPGGELNKDFLLVTQIARTNLGGGYGGAQVGNRVLRWERRENRVLLRSVSYEITADSTLPIYQAVTAANYHPIIAVFNVEAYGPDSAAVIDVTRLFTSPPPELGAGNRIRGSIDPARSFLERALSFPDNIEVEATHTYNPAPTPPATPDTPAGFGQPAPRSISVLMHWSMVRLPEEPMRPRLHDARVGYFSIRQQDFGRDEHRAGTRRYITRWRLEKKDPSAERSDPVKPIVYYVDPATPSKWVPYIRRGIEAWQKAFEEAGFTNAILARDAPTAAEDPEWSAEDARYSVVRWLPSTIENAMGPHVHDPRTGEILESDIQMYHNVMNLLRDWYFVQVAPLDPRARRLPLPDSLMGRLIEYVVAHEVGHTLGFPHNQKASATYPADSVRSVSFLRRMGHTPTLMDYSRFNYVAQPEDSVPPELLIPDIGPYDRFATMWGYKPIPEAATPDDERPVLDEWAREQDTKPYLRFSTSNSFGADPADHTEAVGDADPVKSTALGIRNIARIVPMLIPATERPGEDYSDLAELYGRLVGQWATELNHVVNVVGGAETQEKYGGQEGVKFTPLSRPRQAEAMRFLNQHAFRTPTFFLDADVLRRIEVEGAMTRIRRAQERLIRNLLDDGRMQRLIEFEALAPRGTSTYAPGDMLGDLRRGIWSELSSARVHIDPFRRNVQRAYLEVLNEKLNPPATRPGPVTGGRSGSTARPAAPLSSDARALIRGELRDLDTALRSAVARASDRTTRLHLQDARTEIENILDPRK